MRKLNLSVPILLSVTAWNFDLQYRFCAEKFCSPPFRPTSAAVAPSAPSRTPVRSLSGTLGGTPADGKLERGLEPPPAAQLAGIRDPGGLRAPLCGFRSGAPFAYGSGISSTPATQRYPTGTLITPGTEIGGMPVHRLTFRATVCHTNRG